jgi:transcription initiation factor TFIIB
VRVGLSHSIVDDLTDLSSAVNERSQSPASSSRHSSSDFNITLGVLVLPPSLHPLSDPPGHLLAARLLLFPTAKTYSPWALHALHAKSTGSNKTYNGIKKRSVLRSQGKLSGKITKTNDARLVREQRRLAVAENLKKQAKMAAPAAGIENQPPEVSLPFRENLNLRIICPDCKLDPPELIEENADTICANCGMVLAERLISMESEWRTFNSDDSRGDDPNRVGEADNELYNQSNVGTTIGLTSTSSKESKRLRRVQNAQQDERKDRDLQSSYATIDGWAERIELSNAVRNQAKMFYKTVHDANAFRGKSKDAVLASCLFIACRQANLGRTFGEMHGLTSINKKEMGRTFKALQKFLQETSQKSLDEIEAAGGVISREDRQFKSTVSTSPEVLINRFCGQLGYNFRVSVIARKIADKVPGINEIAGRSPLSIAAASLYFATNLIEAPKTAIKDIQPIAGVSEGTIRVSYKLLYSHKDELIEPDWLGAQPGGHGFGKIENLPAS